MNPKITAIILFVVGAGLVLWFFNSGDAAKLGSAFSFSNSSSTATVAASSTSSTSSASSTATATTSKNPIAAFFALLFPPRSTSTLGPSVGSVSAGAGIGGVGQTEISQGGTGSSAGGTAPSAATIFSTASIATSSIPAGYTRVQLSPYFHLVRFDGVGTSQILLYTAGSVKLPTSTVDITGWEIKTNHGGEYIPQAVNIYDPDSTNPESDIILFVNQYNLVYLYSSAAPANLRISECMGYLNDTKQFSPAFPNNCPSVNRSQISNFTGQCQNYILSLGGCSTANLQSPQIPRTDYACQQYIEDNFTYESCVANNDHSANFLTNQWRVWTDSTPLDKYHDNVELLDNNGLVVDTYNY